VGDSIKIRKVPSKKGLQWLKKNYPLVVNKQRPLKRVEDEIRLIKTQQRALLVKGRSKY
jgi:hypothetical protein